MVRSPEVSEKPNASLTTEKTSVVRQSVLSAPENGQMSHDPGVNAGFQTTKIPAGVFEFCIKALMSLGV